MYQKYLKANDKYLKQTLINKDHLAESGLEEYLEKALNSDDII